ncbi:MAG: DEAD/DEAH box helicase [Gemmatimonadetes bacterium]|nr:DEAD/DEAH box helicase [Gemmatimonadota bacterium]MYJ10113.1 DEAD/DEAH box helicase [Gemmatimonadota bacterium]
MHYVRWTDRGIRQMDVFAFRDELVAEYSRFSRSFTRIRAPDISRAVDAAYAAGRFWPAPLIQLNPSFEPGGWIDEIVSEGVLDPECANIFRLKNKNDEFGKPLRLHRHQTDAIEIANRRESYVLTTGTGSGKSLAYFIPIVDDVLRRRKVGKGNKGISAIVVYPMNALCNSQREELDRFLRLGYGEGSEPVTFARYTGQESNEERERIAKNPPDILLTNYVMLELLMTRFHETDKAVRRHAEGLRFLVLDELHTYRGRQGADVAMLVRRVRERFNDRLLCIGTSATMASEGSEESRNEAVADIASQLFGAPVDPGKRGDGDAPARDRTVRCRERTRTSGGCRGGHPARPRLR